MNNPQSKRLLKRHRAEKRFQLYGKMAISIALISLTMLISSLLLKGYPAFFQTFIALELTEDNYQKVTNASVAENRINKKLNVNKIFKSNMMQSYPEIEDRSIYREFKRLFSNRGSREAVMTFFNNSEEGNIIWIPASDRVDQYIKGNIDPTLAESDRKITDQQIAWIEKMKNEGKVEKRFNINFFTSGDSSVPELAGILGAMVGSAFTMLVTLLFAFPIAVATGVYLEEFAKKNKLTEFIEVNINNLAAVPSIIFGLLGLAIFIQFFGLPRSAPLVGGMVLGLMTLPTIIISTRVSLQSVPQSIRSAALGLGASKFQSVFHHALPLALPGILTGTIIGLARALGETAPLLMIGMVAFIVDIPQSLTDSATVLPVQIFLWADKPERGFVEKTAAAILILLFFLIIMNSLAIYLRKKFERKW